MRLLVRKYTTTEFRNPDACDYCRTGRACYQIVEEYGPDPELLGDEGENLIIHQALS